MKPSDLSENNDRPTSQPTNKLTDPTIDQRRVIGKLHFEKQTKSFSLSFSLYLSLSLSLSLSPFIYTSLFVLFAVAVFVLDFVCDIAEFGGYVIFVLIVDVVVTFLFF